MSDEQLRSDALPTSELVTMDIRIVEVRYLYRHGHLIAYSLSDDDLYAIAPSMRLDHDKQILTKVEQAGVVNGKVFDWSEGEGRCPSLKIHWNCELCNQQWWVDFLPEMPNPLFEASGCACVPYWFVSWDEQQVQDELCKHSVKFWRTASE